VTGRPSVSLIVPFAGSAADLEQLKRELPFLTRTDRDEVIIADNRRGTPTPDANGSAYTDSSAVRVCAARGPSTPAFARNCGARVATGEWLVFIDADTRPAPSLLDDYFNPPPDPQTAILAGTIDDVADKDALVARHGVARGRMNQQTTLDRAGRSYAQTANCAVRRSAFEAVGGFEPLARAGEDADLCFRLQRAGWRLEPRERAVVAHRSRDSLGSWLLQLARHGSGAAWLNRRWGEFAPPRPRQLGARLARSLAAAARALARGDREAAAFALLDLAGACAFELGRLGRNRAPRFPAPPAGNS
jgi:GT2 family glycosyltransferase